MKLVLYIYTIWLKHPDKPASIKMKQVRQKNLNELGLKSPR